LFYDVEGFLFYVLCECDEKGAHFAAYFSRELNKRAVADLPIVKRPGQEPIPTRSSSVWISFPKFLKGEYELMVQKESLATAIAQLESGKPKSKIDPALLIWLDGDEEKTNFTEVPPAPPQ
jgi:hypothetical protein